MAQEGSFDPRRPLENPNVYRRFQSALLRKSTRTRILDFLGVRPGHRVLDVGCGTADIRAHLPDDIDYHGYDLNERYIEAARLRYGSRGAFFVKPVTPEAAHELGTFDVVISIGVLHHLTDKEVDTVFASAREVLRPGGMVVTCDGAYVAGQNPIAKLLLALDRGRHVRRADRYLALAQPHFPNATATILHDLLAVPYTHCVIQASR